MIWIVEGSTGEYSDRREWPVRAFSHKDEAEALVLALDEWCRVNGCAYDADVRYDRYDLVPPQDPYFQCDYTGTRYTCYPVPIDDEPDRRREQA